MSKPVILVTNDDGIHSHGLHALATELETLGEVWIVAPDRERSAVSHSITMYQPLRVTRVREQVYTLDGTPADCVIFGVKGFLDERPELVVSGINRGPNLGDDVVYSGTVAGAHEGHLCGIPSLAVSLNVSRTEPTPRFDSAAQCASVIAGQILERELPEGTFLNVNVPNQPFDDLEGFVVTRLGQRVYHDMVDKRIDPHGNEYFWIGGSPPSWVPGEGTDFHALEEGKVSITPLGQDFTQFHAIPELDRWQMSPDRTSRSG